MDNPHTNHRKRLKERAVNNGLGSLDDVTLLELILTYAIPRKDTRPFAAILLEKYGSLYAVFNTDIAELESICGISRHTAVMFKAMAELTKRLVPVNDELCFEKEEIAGPYLVTCYSGEKRERVLLLTLTPSGALINTHTVEIGSINSASFPMRKLTELSLRDDASKVIIAHNHPDGPLYPSIADIDATDRIAKGLKINNVILCQHYIVSGNKYVTVIDS